MSSFEQQILIRLERIERVLIKILNKLKITESVEEYEKGVNYYRRRIQ